MSYILEALKKAQAERQLGALPTIHAAPFQAGMPGVAGAPARTPLWLALSVPVLLVLLALLIWRQPWHSAVPAVAAVAVPAVPVLAAASAPPVAPVPAAPSAPRAAPILAASPLAAAPVRATPDSHPSPSLRAAAKPTAPAPATDDVVLNLRDLPEPIQRQIPPLALGGYIYSRNPADRILLIDKVLRHEGEEVAPGVTLEKLESKAAVFSFKGYRYRSPY